MDRVAKFWMKVSAEPGQAGCWLWTGARTTPRQGEPYGRVRVGGRWMMATRFVWELERGPLPPGQMICHRCDRPLCVRPNHLFAGSALDNVRDMQSKGRAPYSRPGESNGNAVLSDAQVAELRRLYWIEGVKQIDLAPRFGISKVQVSKIIREVTRPA